MNPVIAPKCHQMNIYQGFKNAVQVGHPASLQWHLCISIAILFFHILISLFQGAGWRGKTACKYYFLFHSICQAQRPQVWRLLDGWSHHTDIVGSVLEFALHQFLGANCVHLFLTPRLLTPCCQLVIDHGGSIFTMEIGKHYKSGPFPPLSQLLNIYQHILGRINCHRVRYSSFVCSSEVGPFQLLANVESLLPAEELQQTRTTLFWFDFSLQAYLLW